jgi:asparagine synthase (glutamine-hydrolysing)
LARREGYSDPLPATIRSGFPENDETAWQELVVRQLGLKDWHRIAIRHELELVGTVAATALRRRGVVYPFNTHYIPYAATGSGAKSLVYGLDGDGLLGGYLWMGFKEVLSRQRRPTRMDLDRALLALAPRVVRQAWAARRLDVEAIWLREAARRIVARTLQRQAFAEPVTWPRRLGWYVRDPIVRAACDAIDADLAYAGVRGCAPFWDLRVVAAVARDGGVLGYGSRTTAMRRIFGAMLPDRVIARPDKGFFEAVFWGPQTQGFIDSWDGTGLDDALVDADVLRQCWREQYWPGWTALPLQAAWLAADRRDEDVDRLVDPREVPRPR